MMCRLREMYSGTQAGTVGPCHLHWNWYNLLQTVLQGMCTVHSRTASTINSKHCSRCARVAARVAASTWPGGVATTLSSWDLQTHRLLRAKRQQRCAAFSKTCAGRFSFHAQCCLCCLTNKLALSKLVHNMVTLGHASSHLTSYLHQAQHGTRMQTCQGTCKG